MSLYPTRPKINEVFTPRRSKVNISTYISRPVLEKELKRALQGSLHVLIFGNSGTGKSWLFKKVLTDLNAKSRIANCANANRFGSITNEIAKAVFPRNYKILEGLEEEINANVSAVVAKGGAKSKRKHKVMHRDTLLEAFQFFRDNSGSSLAVLVLDNLETIINNDKIMDELADIITLCDDSRYSEFNIKILIVGVPSSVLNYFSSVKNLPTVANRIHELSEVTHFTDTQVSAFVETGFIHLLKVSINKGILDEWKRHIFSVTLGIPQRLHEYCELLAYQLEDKKWNASIDLLSVTNIEWIKQGLREAYSVIDSLMNERETEIGRRNQVLYSLGLVDSHSFSPKNISEKLKKEFPKSTTGVRIGVNTILNDLAAQNNSIIRRCNNGKNYEFTDPRYLMVMRIMLKKLDNETIKKLSFRL